MKIGQDKKLHFALSTFISIVFMGIADITNISVWYGFFAVVLILAGKELIWDWALGKGTPDWMDFVFGLVPAIFILLISF
ncbi:hypothetical protein N8Y76_01940, partial [Flavobacteriaceae bacterium]|nr:hypothetical protein [Flavobacteriaceae bacterium]